MLFVKCLLDAAATLETFSEMPVTHKCCMRASIQADGMPSLPRCDLVEIYVASLNGTSETEVDPHTAGSGAETMAEMATRGQSE